MPKNNIPPHELYTLLRITINTIATSKYRDKFFIKGGSALMSKLLENSRTDLFRQTTDTVSYTHLRRRRCY